MKKPLKKLNADSVLAIIFIVILAVVYIANIIVPDKDFSSEENRMLQLKPKFSLSSYTEGRYEKKLETYANDQFILRNSFIHVKTAADITLGQKESNNVYKCKDDYLIEKIEKPNEKYMEETYEGLIKFRKEYPSMKMYFLLAPNAGNILSDKLPLGVKLPNQSKDIKKFYEKLNEIAYTTIDVEEDLKSSRNNLQLYYRTDHHWTSDGAFIAYKKAADIMDLKDSVEYTPYVVKNDFRGTLASKSGFTNGKNDPMTIYLPADNNYKNSVIFYGDTKEKTTEFYKLENLDTKDSYTVFGGSNHPIYSIKTPVDSNRKLLLFKDSYANSMIPFLAQNFREIIVVDPRYYFDNIDDLIISEGITDTLFLYNGNTFFSDNSLGMLLNS